MKKNIIITTFLIIIFIQAIVPIKIYGISDYEKREIQSIPAIIEYKKADSKMDLYAGIVIEPAVEFVTVLVDGIITLMTSFMIGESPLDTFVMVTNKQKIRDFGDAEGAPLPIDTTDYGKIWYPNFKFTPEEIFAGEIEILDANFMNDTNGNKSWGIIRNVVSTWYKVFRMIAILGLLSLLIFTGTKIILASTAKDKSKYKELLINWLIACILLFTMQYIMSFIMNLTEEVTSLLKASGTIEVDIGSKGTFKTNMVGLARFQLQERSFTGKITFLIMYVCLIVYTVKFTFVYLKRLLTMSFLTIIAPLVAFMYPIDKLDGNATNFNMWLKEYLFNALLQPVHYLLFLLCVSSAISLVSANMIFAIAAMAAISQGEKLLKKIFGFDKAREGTVGGIAGGVAAGAIVGNIVSKAKSITGMVKSGGNGSSGKANGTGGSNFNSTYNEQLPSFSDYNQDSLFDEFLGEEQTSQNSQTAEGPAVNVEQNENPNVGEVAQFRGNLSNIDLGNLNFNDGDTRNMGELLGQYSQLQMALQNPNNTPQQMQDIREQISGIESLLKNRVLANELPFSNNGINPQYIDGNSMSSMALLNEAMNNKQKAHSSRYTPEQREYFNDKSETAMDTLNRRMLENQYMSQGADAQQNRNTTPIRKMAERFGRGMGALGSKAIRPVWDTRRTAGQNFKRVGVGLVKTGIGVSAGLVTATVQAGISIADGKYSPLEGVASFAAGAIGTSRLIDSAGNNGIVNTYKQAANAGDEQAQLKEYSKNWFNRDDVIEKYEKEFPGQGKQMRKRAAENLVSRGITDFGEQKQALKFAEQIKSQKGLSEEEADRVAVATMQYKRNLLANGSYAILFDSKKKSEYIESQVKAYRGSASEDAVRKLHNDFIQNIIDFDKANR